MHELLALEAIARLGSVQAAAEALHVTPSGVSHRVGSLERRIGAKLLRRQGRGVVLTDVARRCVDAVRPSFAELSAATARLRSREHDLVRIATAPAIGAARQQPQLARYAAVREDARFEIVSVATTDELPPDRWDVLIHYGEHPRRGSLRRRLFDDRLCRVCAPSLADSRGASQPVLRLAQLHAPAAASVAPAAPSQLIFDDALAMLEAAEDGGPKTRLRCAACGWTHWNNPTPVLAAVIECADRGGQVLLARNAAWPSKMFALITGFMEAGETPQDGIVREIKEETQLDTRSLALVGVYDFQRMNQVIIAFHAVCEGEVRLSPELADWRLYDPPQLKCWPAGTGYALADWLRARGHEPVFFTPEENAERRRGLD